MKRKIATIREHATERLQLGAIGALGMVITVFVLLGNVSMNPARLRAVNISSVDTLWSYEMENKILKPPETQKVVLFDVAKDGDKITDSLPPIQPDSLEFIPGRNTIILALDSVKFVPRGAKYPEIVGELNIRYPDHLKMRGIQGTAVITVGLDETGKVFAGRITKSSGNATLDSLALKGVSEARFTPAMQGNKAIPVKINVPIVFQLDR